MVFIFEASLSALLTSRHGEADCVRCGSNKWTIWATRTPFADARFPKKKHKKEEDKEEGKVRRRKDRKRKEEDKEGG